MSDLNSVDISPKLEGMLETVFDKLTAKETCGLMRFRQWQRATHFLEQNPVLRGCATQSDIDRLFYAQSHRTTVRCGITRREFIGLLTQLSQGMNVPAALVLLAVGCHAEFLNAEDAEEPSIRSNAVTFKRKLPVVMQRVRTV